MSSYTNFSYDAVQFFSKQIDDLLPEVNWRLAVPINRDTDPDAKVVRYETVTPGGEAIVVNSGMGPVQLVNQLIDPDYVVIENVMAGFTITVDEMALASKNGMESLSVKGLRRAVDCIERQMSDKILVSGIGSQVGLFSAQTQVQVAPATTSGTDYTWAEKTSQQMLDDITTGVTAMINESNGACVPNVCAVDPGRLVRLQGAIVPDTGRSVRAICEQDYNLTFVPLVECSTNGTGSTACFVLMDNRNDNLWAEVPREADMIGEPVWTGTTWEYTVRARCGGFVLPHKPALKIYYNI